MRAQACTWRRLISARPAVARDLKVAFFEATARLRSQPEPACPVPAVARDLKVAKRQRVEPGSMSKERLLGLIRDDDALGLKELHWLQGVG